MHGAPYLVERLASGLTGLVGALSDNTAHELRIVLEFLSAFAHSGDLLDDLVDDRLLAFQATDAGCAAALARPAARALVGIDLVQVPHRTLVGIARIGATHARRIGDHRAQLLRHNLRLFAQPNGVAIGLRHLAPVEPGHPGSRRQQHLWLGQDGDARALEVAEEPFAIGESDPGVRLDQRAGPLQRLRVAGFLEGAAQLAIGAAVASAKTLDGALALGFELGLASVEMVEAPRNLAGQLDVRHLVLTDRHVSGAVDQYVGALQQGIAEERVSGKVFLPELILLILVARHAL